MKLDIRRLLLVSANIQSKLIEAFRVEQLSMEILQAKLRTGNIYPRKKEFLEKDKLIYDMDALYEMKEFKRVFC